MVECGARRGEVQTESGPVRARCVEVILSAVVVVVCLLINYQTKERTGFRTGGLESGRD